ncbi:hypothetical protein RGR602_PC02266 (plasmid) [Rhizobium gallicum bv. gallicum R602sp]|uniref:Uncharacterized protein n=1 Tax=Rhizobium gallicum bv. gallicum R602sp TaxID=1041138 RepID=A0A0B4XHQ6_9HYPH|nr:hypothetical protein RGR602_PC02266 [Rhizobium gallicum bv. gallicum R602sp]
MDELKQGAFCAGCNTVSKDRRFFPMMPGMYDGSITLGFASLAYVRKGLSWPRVLNS